MNLHTAARYQSTDVHLLRLAVQRFRPGDVRRLEPYFKRPQMVDAIAYEVFGMPAQRVFWSPNTELVRDWRLAERRRQRRRLGGMAS